MRRDRKLFILLTGFLLAAGCLSLDAAETAVVTEGKINVRGKPNFVGEVVTQLERGEKVTVIERITNENPRPGEPTNWAKIKLPENTPAWVFAPFVKEGKVAASRLNLRAGPSEAWSVIGQLNRGEEVKEIRTVAEWMEIEAPENAYAFIDLSLVRFEDGTSAPAVSPPVAPVQQPQGTPPEVVTTPAAEPESVPTTKETSVAAAPAQPTTSKEPDEPVSSEQTPELAEASSETERVATAEPPSIEETTAPPVVSSVPESKQPEATAQPQFEPLPEVGEPLPARSSEPAGRRIVRREGVIRATRSIQAPTWYELVHPATGKTINYLYDQKFGAASGIKLKDYRGQKVVVTGEEGIDTRWPNTPILDLETLDLLP